MTATHNHAPQAPAELTAAERTVFSVDKLNEWRTTQHAILHSVKFGNGPNSFNLDWQADFEGGVDDSLDMFLEQSGISNDSANFTEVHQLLRDASIDKISEDEWGNSPASRGVDANDTKSQSDKFKERIDIRLEQGSHANGSVDIDALHTEAFEINQIFDDLQSSREAWATASAKRQGRIGGKAKDHASLKDAYTAKLREFGVFELQGEITDDDDTTTKNAKVIEYLFNEQKKLRELTTEKLKGTKVGKFVEFMNRGRLATRIAKGVGFGLVVGATGGFALGAIGAAGAGAAAVGVSRFVKGYASNDKHRGMRTAEESFIDSDGNRVYLDDDAGTTIESKFDTAAQIYDEDFEKDTKREQIKRRKALAWGIGSVAIGTSVGYLASNFDEVSDKVGDIKGRVDNWINDTPNGDSTSQTDGQGVIDNDNHDTVPGHEFHQTPDQTRFAEIGHDARWVEPGEGWYQTFNELGIPQDNWQDVLQDAGPKLHEQGWAYRMPDGQWGISQPGRLPDSALRVIAESSKDNGYKLVA
jgi:hypothetical protein